MSKDLTTLAADNIRILSAAMVEKARSGHPGGAMGGADFYIFSTRNTSGMTFGYDLAHARPFLSRSRAYVAHALFGAVPFGELQHR